MKFSVLLPTRNRLEYLKYAVETVLRQDYDDWEIIISDNFSEQDIAGYVRSLDDPRIKYYRTDSFVSVTENWNNALDKSSGEYVIMLGDDDCLMKGHLATMRRLIDEYTQPDFVYTDAFLYAYPGVMPGHPEGFLTPWRSEFTASAKGPFLLDKERALKVVEQAMSFDMLVAYNSQYFVVSRKFIDSLHDRGDFFQSPFPDFYATNIMFLKAERILVYPRPLVTIGITPKSYGFFHFNKREAEGVEFLNSLPDLMSFHDLRHVLLPGSNMYTSWLLALETIRANYGSELSEFNLRVNYRRYRSLQISYVYQSYYAKLLSKEDLRELKHQMSLRERLTLLPRHAWMSVRSRLVRAIPPVQRAWLKWMLRRPQVDAWGKEAFEQRYGNILEVFEQVDP